MLEGLANPSTVAEPSERWPGCYRTQRDPKSGSTKSEPVLLDVGPQDEHAERMRRTFGTPPESAMRKLLIKEGESDWTC